MTHKLFAQILLKRLQDAGAERLIWKTQFGFQRGRGTNDALFVARRALERAWALKDGKVAMLALDWAKAFDSVSPSALSDAMVRFGVPQPFVDMVKAIYTNREFVVRDAGETSSWHAQSYGISQGCPLSPFLFIMMMTVLLHDAKGELVNTLGVKLDEQCLVHELVYANDTLLMDTDPQNLEQFMNCIGKAGQAYGLSFNWSKLEMLPVKVTGDIYTPEGAKVAVTHAIIYLGSALSVDCQVGPGLSRRLSVP